MGDPRTEILELLEAHSEGLGAAGLLRRLSGGLSRRSLQRKLRALVDAGSIVPEGRGRARVYRTATEAGAEPLGVPISHAGAAVLASVRRPLSARAPTSYDRRMLGEYTPNDDDTAYLSQQARARLHELGGTERGPSAAGTFAREILGRLIIDLSWASSRLEGNTYSLLDTRNLIERGREASGKDRREAQMILNHKSAIEMLVENVEQVDIDRFTLCNLHATLADNLLANSAEAGRTRHRIVGIGGSVYYPLAVPQEIDHHFDLLCEKGAAITDPFEQALFVMVHVPYLQPFIDVNKRVSRLAANISLIKNNLRPLSFVDVPGDAYTAAVLGVYERRDIALLRDVFVWAYERSCQRYAVIRETMAEPDAVRLENREAISAVVRDIVQNLEASTAETVRAAAAGLVDDTTMPRFTEIVLGDLAELHEGNISRYGLRLSELRAWQAARKG